MASQTHAAKTKYADALLRRRNVCGVGIGHKVTRGQDTGDESVVVFVMTKQSRAFLADADLVPDELEGVPTDVVEVGYVRAQELQGGASCGHYAITAGTAGVRVIDNETGLPVLLSNNHVLANENNAYSGDYILSPGPIDGGTVAANTIGFLRRFGRIYYHGETPPPEPKPVPEPSGCSLAVPAAIAKAFRRPRTMESSIYNNRVDAAIANFKAGVTFLPGVQQIGLVTGQLDDVGLNAPVQKFGRTTQHTNGMILYLDAIIDVSYSGGKVARYGGQYVASAMSAPGDSGSLVLTPDRRAVGLLFAGSERSTIINPIADVLKTLNISLEVSRA